MRNATKIGVIVLGSLSFALVMSGCAKVPQGEVDSAKAAVEAAEAAEAETYAADSYAAVREKYSALEAELKNQEELSGMKRNYDKTIAVAVEVKAAGERAVSEATQAKETLKKEVMSMVSTLEGELAAASELLDKASKVRGIKLDLKTVETDLDNSANLLDEAKKDYDEGNYMNAKQKVMTVNEQRAVGTVLVQTAIDAATKPVVKH